VSRIENEINESSIMSKFLYFEVTAHGFDGGIDTTDDSVLWVKYDLSDTSADAAALIVAACAEHTGATVTGLPADHISDEADLDFHLPNELSALEKRLLVLKCKNVLRTTEMEPRPVSEKARALVDKVWVTASGKMPTLDGTKAIDKLMTYIQQLENNQKV
jgi:hypothetical protein